MARYAYQGTTRNQEGAVIFSATVSVFLTGTATPASIYAASSGGVAVNSVDSSATTGVFLFYVDDTDYAVTQRFDLTVSKSISTVASYAPVTISDVRIFPFDYAVSIDVKTVSADYEPVLTANVRNIIVIDSGDDPRNVNPSVVALSLYEVTIVNAGTQTITFDSAGIATTVAAGAKTLFVYDGSAWN